MWLGQGIKRRGRGSVHKRKETGEGVQQKIKAVKRCLKLGSREASRAPRHQKTMWPHGMLARMEPRQAVESWHGLRSQVPRTAETGRRRAKGKLGDGLTLVQGATRAQ